MQGITKIVPVEKDNRALSLLQAIGGDFDPNSEETKKIVKKIDLIVLPLLCAIYTLMLMDKSSLSFGAIMGIKEDCHLTGSEYSWLGSLI
jgi:MFS transporter, ACS family, allantoate permease